MSSIDRNIVGLHSFRASKLDQALDSENGYFFSNACTASAFTLSASIASSRLAGTLQEEHALINHDGETLLLKGTTKESSSSKFEHA